MTSQIDYEINKELGECYLFMGEVDKAEEYYKKASGSNGQHPDPYLGLATIAVHRGEMDKALTLYKKAHDIKSDDKSLTGMGMIELQKGDYEACFAHMSEALEHNPENLVAIYNLVQAAHNLKRLEEAIPRLNNCLALNPDLHDVRFSLAGCLMALNRKGEAMGQLERILDAQPDHVASQELYAILKP